MPCSRSPARAEPRVEYFLLLACKAQACLLQAACSAHGCIVVHFVAPHLASPSLQSLRACNPLM